MTLPRHVSLIPDGNRRWAKAHGIPYEEAYDLGANRCVDVAKLCLKSGGITTLTAYGSSHDNVTKRPANDIIAMHNAAIKVCRTLIKDPQIQLRIVGQIDEIPESYGRSDFLGFNTQYVDDPRLTIYIAINYSHCDMINPELVPDVDLVIRTGGRLHLSGFLPIQSAQAELRFLPMMWPDFLPQHFNEAVVWYGEQIRLGGE